MVYSIIILKAIFTNFLINISATQFLWAAPVPNNSFFSPFNSLDHEIFCFKHTVIYIVCLYHHSHTEGIPFKLHLSFDRDWFTSYDLIPYEHVIHCTIKEYITTVQHFFCVCSTSGAVYYFKYCQLIVIYGNPLSWKKYFLIFCCLSGRVFLLEIFVGW